MYASEVKTRSTWRNHCGHSWRGWCVFPIHLCGASGRASCRLGSIGPGCWPMCCEAMKGSGSPQGTGGSSSQNFWLILVGCFCCYCSFAFFCFVLETWPHAVAQANLEFTMYPRLALNLRPSSCLSCQSAGIRRVTTTSSSVVLKCLREGVPGSEVVCSWWDWPGCSRAGWQGGSWGVSWLCYSLPWL